MLRFRLLFLLLIQICIIHGQNDHYIHIDPTAPTLPADPELKPGLFYFQHWQQTQNAVFNYISKPNMYNALRQQKFSSECWKWSSGFDDVLTNMESTNLKEWLIHLGQYSDHVVVKFNGMPHWISSSNDWNTIPGDDSWLMFMTYPPADYQVWDSLITQIVLKIKSWGLHPYYEIWNEPDGQYWNASDADLLELYRHTAKTINQADPQAKVGGFGMHNWWKSVDPDLYQQQEPYKHPMWGYVNEDIVNQYSILYDLLDSVANNWREQHIPLDFVSYHFFSWKSNVIPHAADQLRAKMESLGYVDPFYKEPDDLAFPDLYVSEWQTTYGIQEKLFQPPLFLKIMSQMDKGDINFHTIAAIGDFDSNPDNEFHEGWGMFTQNGLIKPVFKSLLLLSEVIGNGEMINVESSDGLDVFASIKDDTLRVLASNYPMPNWWYSNYWKFAWAAYEKLLFDTTSVYTMSDFLDNGYTSVYWGNSSGGSFGNVDNFMMGNGSVLPDTPPEMELALINAKHQYFADSLANLFPHQLEMSIDGQPGILEGRMVRIDSTRNNVVYLYDSLVNTAGYSNARAVDSLQSCTFPGGCFGIYHEYKEIQFEDGLIELTLDPNSVVYVEVPGIDLTTDVFIVDMDNAEAVILSPNPVNNNSVLKISGPLQSACIVDVFSFDGTLIKTIQHFECDAKMVSIPIGKDIVHFASGIYLLKVRYNNRSAHIKAIIR